MKINTLSLRAKFRDYYDLYTLSKDVFDIKKMFDLSIKYIPGITRKIFAMQLTYIEDIDDENIQHLKPKLDVTLDEIKKYFEEQVSNHIL